VTGTRRAGFGGGDHRTIFHLSVNYPLRIITNTPAHRQRSHIPIYIWNTGTPAERRSEQTIIVRIRHAERL